MSADIIQFSAFADAAKEAKEEAANDPCARGALARYRAQRVAKQIRKQMVLATAPETLTETCKNKYAREARREVWRRHESSMEYWFARREMHSAIGRVKSNKVAESDLHPDYIQHEFHQFVDFWRAAKRTLLFTPAPDRQAVEWKQRQLKGDKGLKYCGIEPGQIKRAIDEDIAWLKGHPTRTKLLPKRGQK
jgi:hypothetical protein